jgi:pyridoxamine 5'-phosphate oxidase
MVENEKIAALRRDYRTSELLESSVDRNPFKQFHTWFDQALDAELPEPNAMCLSTVHEGRPESRIVLLKGITDEGFMFFTNYNSAKGKDIEKNSHVALNFVWLELERQVRIDGVAIKTSEEENDKYFYSRPLGSQIGAIISEQSGLLASRSELERALEEAEKKYVSENPVRPSHWGGYIVKPDLIEFWQGRSNRLHDRLRYELQDKEWKISRLYP